MNKNRFIIHVDMDAFFAAIEQRDNPGYRMKPVVVGADPMDGRGRGVVSTCSYEARRFGIHSAMPISVAYKKCPHAVFLPVDMDKYAAVSSQIYDILYSFTPDIEPVSIDEAFLDITGSYHLFGTPHDTCLKIKRKVNSETGLTASVGLAPTKMAAKIASDLKKPDGLVEVAAKDLTAFLRPLEIGRIWGLGGKAEKALSAIGITTIGNLADIDPGRLTELFGKNGLHFWQLANGIDERIVAPVTEAKSISGEMTFERDTSDAFEIGSGLMRLCEKVSRRLRQDDLRCKTITLKIRLSGFQTYTRSLTIALPTNFADVLYNHIKALYNKFDRGGKMVRLIGVKASHIIPSGYQYDLFGPAGERKMEDIHTAVDKIHDKFGEGYICHASSAFERKKPS